MTARTHEFFPPAYKQFPFKEGDLLVSERSDGSFAVNRILKVDRVDLKEGESIVIQNATFTATCDDYLLVVGAAYGEREFATFEEARMAADAGNWTVRIGHAPNRTPGAAEGQTYVGNRPVEDAELGGYRQWRKAFDAGDAGIF